MANKIDKLVIDTSLLISFLISNTFSKLDKQIQTNKIKFLFSEELIDEFLEVTSRPKFKKYFHEKDISSLLQHLQNYSEIIDVRSKVNVCRDKKDNFLLALCEDGNADFLLTGDEDLLVLKKHKKTTILKITDYLKTI